MKESRYNVRVERDDATYVFNGVSGALLRVAKTDYDAVRRYLAGGQGSCSPEVLGHLAEGLMVIPDNADELAFLERRYAAGRRVDHERSAGGQPRGSRARCRRRN